MSFEEDNDLVVAKLGDGGVEVSSVHDLASRSATTTKAAARILADTLPLLTDLNARESVVRSLASKTARQTHAAQVLVDEWRRARSERWRYNWAVGNSLEVIADDSVFDELVALAHDRQCGRAREMVVLAFTRMKERRQDAIQVLAGLLSDTEVLGHVLSALRKLKATNLDVEQISPALQDKRAWVRKEAAKLLAKQEGYSTT